MVASVAVTLGFQNLAIVADRPDLSGPLACKLLADCATPQSFAKKLQGVVLAKDASAVAKGLPGTCACGRIQPEIPRRLLVQRIAGIDHLVSQLLKLWFRNGPGGSDASLRVVLVVFAQSRHRISVADETDGTMHAHHACTLLSIDRPRSSQQRAACPLHHHQVVFPPAPHVAGVAKLRVPAEPEIRKGERPRAGRAGFDRRARRLGR